MTFDYVLANPPFGKKSSMSFTNADGEQRNLSTTLRHSPLQFTVQDLLSLDWVG